MQINDELVDKLAKLARLSFSDTEKLEIRKDLEKMIGFVDKLNELDTSGVEPLLHITAAKNVFREDEAFQGITREDALKNAPLSDDIFFKVPKVIKK